MRLMFHSCHRRHKSKILIKTWNSYDSWLAIRHGLFIICFIEKKKWVGFLFRCECVHQETFTAMSRRLNESKKKKSTIWIRNASPNRAFVNEMNWANDVDLLRVALKDGWSIVSKRRLEWRKLKKFLENYLILGGITNQTFGIGKCDIAWCSAVSLVVGNNLDFSMLPDANAGVCCAQVNSNSWCHFQFVCQRVCCCGNSEQEKLITNWVVDKLVNVAECVRNCVIGPCARNRCSLNRLLRTLRHLSVNKPCPYRHMTNIREKYQ